MVFPINPDLILTQFVGVSFGKKGSLLLDGT
jgi:hypothetical protein